jgi:anti-sigma factor RsiW
MCDDRERLIGYLYGECDARERGEIDRHLDSCGVCRDEIAGLRQTRQDLLAWDVPGHEPVWRPVVPVPAVAWWRQVPAWAMAAAATLTFLVGAAGGVMTHVFLPSPAPAQVVSVPAAAVVPAGVSQADMTALEQRVLQTMRTEFDERFALVSAHQPTLTAGVRTNAALADRLAGQLGDLTHWRGQQLDLNRATVEDIRLLNSRLNALETRSDQLHNALAQRASLQGK